MILCVNLLYSQYRSSFILQWFSFFRFEDNLQKKSDWITNELVKLSLRVQELEELGEILNIQQYTYVRFVIFPI